MTDQPKEYYEKRPGFIVKSGTPDIAGKKIDYAVFTDNGQGFEYTQEGNKYDACKKTSYETVGEGVNEGEPAKIIKAKNGDVIIEAVAGDLILRARNIRIVAMDGSGEVTINSAKQVSIQAPIQNFKGTNLNTVMSNSYSVGALSVDTTGVMQNTQNTEGEKQQSGILNQILGAVKKFQKFFE
jgi:hypothetical protein